MESQITLLVWPCLSLKEKQRTINHISFLVIQSVSCNSAAFESFAEAHICFLVSSQGFPNNIPPSRRGIENFTGGRIFLIGERNLRRNDFDNMNLFQSLKQLSVNTEHQLKSILTWSKFSKSIKLKLKWTGAMTTAKNVVLLGYNLKIVIYWGGWFLVGGEGDKIWWGESTGGDFFRWGGGGNEKMLGWWRGLGLSLPSPQ